LDPRRLTERATKAPVRFTSASQFAQYSLAPSSNTGIMGWRWTRPRGRVTARLRGAECRAAGVLLQGELTRASTRPVRRAFLHGWNSWTPLRCHDQLTDQCLPTGLSDLRWDLLSAFSLQRRSRAERFRLWFQVDCSSAWFFPQDCGKAKYHRSAAARYAFSAWRASS